jgi:phage FluMu protein gp41
MTEQSTPNAESSPPPGRIDDLFKLTLADGLTLEAGGKTIRYQVVTLRETHVADERKAEMLSERAIQAGGSWKLLVSESNFKHALNMLHIESFHCDGQTIPQAMIDLAMYDRLSSRDLEMLEERIFLLTLAAEVRYGNMTQEDFDNTMAGLMTKPAVQSAPQPSGQAASVGASDERAESGPTLLTDFAGDAANGQAQSDGQAVQ